MQASVCMYGGSLCSLGGCGPIHALCGPQLVWALGCLGILSGRGWRPMQTLCLELPGKTNTTRQIVESSNSKTITNTNSSSNIYSSNTGVTAGKTSTVNLNLKLQLAVAVVQPSRRSEVVAVPAPVCEVDTLRRS